MQLNGWQRIYSLLVVAWISYWAFAAYSDNALIDSRITELHAAVERHQQQPPTASDPSLANSFIHHFQGGSPEQRLALYKEQLLEVQQNKSANNIFLLLVATVPPVVIYLIIAWVIAGFRQKPS